jgi:hypothetical protein
MADTLAVPLQAVRTFGKNGGGEWHNMLIFGDNLQAMKSLLETKKDGKLCNADGTLGVRLLILIRRSQRSGSSVEGRTRRHIRTELLGQPSWNS